MVADHRLGFRPAAEHAGRTLHVEGTLPEWLSGTLLRNGPGSWNAGRQPLAHWFDGFAMLRRFRIANGEITYTNRFLETKARAYAREHGELGYREFATDPPTGWLDRLRRLRETRITDNACVDLRRIGDRYLATTESPVLTEFDPETLGTRGQYAFAVGDTMTVHPHHDPVRGESVGYATTLAGKRSGYTLYSIADGTEDRTVIGHVASTTPGYIHSFALTPRYIVLVEPPFAPTPRKLLTGTSVIDSFEWRPERGTRFHVVARDSGAVVARYRTPAFFCFHHVNAFERPPNDSSDTDLDPGFAVDVDSESDSGATSGSALVLDLVAFENAAIVDALRLRNLLSASPSLPTGELRRFVLPLGRRPDAGGVRSATIHPGPMALPTIDYERRNTRPYRYVYAVGNHERPPRNFQNRLLKVDVREGTTEDWSEPNTYPGEPVFVPAGESDGDGSESEEDQGVVLSVVLDAEAERSFLLALDAATFTERARAWCPHAVPFGFHGHFVPDDAEGPVRSMA